MIDVSEDMIYYAELVYKDNSVRVFRTCVDKQVLTKNFIFPEEYEIYDLDKGVLLSYRECSKVNITKERPEMRYIDEFADLFI